MLLSKGKILLQVHFTDTGAHITPVFGEFDNKELLAAFARNEELLTQLFFIFNTKSDALEHLAEYFKQRGWQVTDPPQHDC
ncbi:hypothetical protein OCK74_11190 [Chitinophagaceae bacterium LB-8]|uniref:Uncharacterized protein n=1 Tax=Paraflavisolibacter caeni TaxID=2982496 RepID=A0A9X3BHI2_9BACT|nr:hypothetical protein [Paraflavisolibacter caeni]MCU7549682.1 hypothetical protein [Paraflavisolibacter caeni]